jgi:glycine oxidase
VQIEPVRGQMIALASPTPPVRHVLYSRRGYLIPRLSGTLIAGSTTEHVGYDKSVSAGGVASIIESSIEILPAARDLPITDSWAGLRPCSPDGLPIIGPDPQIAGLFYATGHYRNGILLAPITAQAVSELIVLGGSRQNLAPFSVTRFSHLGAAG